MLVNAQMMSSEPQLYNVVMQHQDPSVLQKKLVHCLQCQGHSEGLRDQNMTISTISSKVLVCLQPNLIL